MDEVDDILNNNQVVDEEEDDEEMLSGLENDSKQDLEGNDDGDGDGDGDDDDDDDEQEEEDEQGDDNDDDAAKEDKSNTSTDGQESAATATAADSAAGAADATTTTTTDGSDEAEMDGEDEEAKSRESSVNGEVYEYYKHMLQAAQISDSYNIYPTAAIPIQTHVNALAVSRGLRYLFLGGNDGYIRKYDLLNTLEGKLSLTILQKHSLAESIQNAGILQSYWENEIPQKKSEMKLAFCQQGGVRAQSESRSLP